METLQEKESHVFLSLDQDVYGKVRFNISVNFPTLEECEKALGAAIDAVDRVITEKNLMPAERIKEEKPAPKKTTSNQRRGNYGGWA